MIFLAGSTNSRFLTRSIALLPDVRGISPLPAAEAQYERQKSVIVRFMTCPPLRNRVVSLGWAQTQFLTRRVGHFRPEMQLPV